MIVEHEASDGLERVLLELEHSRARAEEEVARFSALASLSPDAVIGVDEARRITSFNGGAERIFGFRAADVVGHEVELLMPERYHEIHRQLVANLVSTPGEASRQMRGRDAIIARRKNGDEFPAEAAISKMEAAGKTIVTVLLRDIAEQTRVEAEQRILAEAGVVLTSSLDSRTTLQSFADLMARNVTDLCIVDMLDGSGRIEPLTVAHSDSAKQSACDALRSMSVDPAHTLARGVFATNRAQLLDDIDAPFLEATATNDEHLRILRELGPRSALVLPLVMSHGVCGAVVLAALKPRRFRERDLHFATELVRRAALAVENARLFEAARRATRARDDVLGIVAHDVRSPLNAIYLAAQWLDRRSIQDPGQREHVVTILRSVGRANRLIEDLLDVTRIEAGALSLLLAKVTATSVVQEVVDLERVSATAAAIDLRFHVDEDVPVFWADRDRLIQVLENLIGNALKFARPGGTISVSATRLPQEVLFSVTDDGPGIPEQSLPFVFDRFWQAERTERRGAGLGLAICKGIVEGHGGRIWAESSPGDTKFFFTMQAVT